MSAGTEVRKPDREPVASIGGASRDESRHGPVAQLLIAWSPLSGILVAYWLAQWITAPLGTGDGADTNRVGAALHVLGPARADELLFGTVPSEWLQTRLLDGGTHWYDVVAALVYVTHFLIIPLLTACTWFRLRERFGEWLTAVLTMSVVGIVIYVGYPAAPPWLASRRGAIGPVERISDAGWEHVGLDRVAALIGFGQDTSNPVAAMPSLHAGAALLTTLFLWPSVGSRLRALLAVYTGAMALTLVYTGEHYVVDVVAGWLVATVGVLVARTARSLDARSLVGLVRASHPGPALAVTVLTGLLAAAQGLDAPRTALLLAAVLAGQLSVGWSNDLIDVGRDRTSGRTDKPLVTGTTPVRLALRACVAAVVVCVILSAMLGPAAGVLHLVCVASAWSYNLGLKATAWSWVPYAVSFGGLPTIVALADGQLPPWWWPVGAALLGVAAHFLNVLPDLDADAATGVQGLPHRLGARLIAPVAAGVLVAASGVVLLGAGAPLVLTAVGAVVVLALAALVVIGTGRGPFVAAVAIALGDALMLVVAR